MRLIIASIIVIFILWIALCETKPFLSPIYEDDYAVYWSGGYNSTFRMLELLRSGITVLPVHVKENAIDTTKLEYLWSEIAQITNLIRPIQYIERVAISSEVNNAKTLGNLPYDLISLSLHYDQKIEICTSFEHELSNIVRPFIKSIEEDSGEADYDWKNKKELRKRALDYRSQMIIMKSIVDERFEIFRNLIFPLAFRTRDHLNNKAERDHYIELLKRTI